MTFVSYAQNFEDVLLWRALGHIEGGFYIDVGASHPDIDSVTRAFYDRGWHGINIEPSDAAYHRLVAARPRDVNLHLAAGATAGTAAFYAVADEAAGLSTLVPAVARRAAELGMETREGTVAVDTLAAICRQHAAAVIHFLKIDVEGAERLVLAGADFAAHRPWIVVVEATAPLSTDEVHAGWEPLLLGAAYRFAWFDGLNRFYVAEEQCDRLMPSFRTPVNVFDDFLRAADTEWTRRIEQAETRASGLEQRTEVAERRAAIAAERAEAAHLRLGRSATEAARSGDIARQRGDEVARLAAALHASTGEAAAARSRADRAEKATAMAEEWLASIRSSTSWRITKPLRRVASVRQRHPAPEPPPAARLEQGPADAPGGDGLAAIPAAFGAHPGPARPEPVGAVHQFHSGTAANDAITNAMLLVRGLLRGLGYESRIFAEHIDPDCGDEIHRLDQLPDHDRYVLIVRHSMGHDAMDRILALPVRKVLLYHNITPPELLPDGFWQDYARKGREQLAELRPAITAALADSDYSAIELRQAGFDAVATCPMLVDIDELRRLAPDRVRTPVYTILFVGRVTASKGQLELVEAYARFRARFARESRLVLVGRSGDGDPYLAEVVGAIRRNKLETSAVEIAGLVSDAELRQRFAEADLYVSLSRHEGFGVPLLEAMVAGIPVLAFPAGAVPYTIGDALPPLEDTTAEGVAARMLELAQDPDRCAAIVERQRQGLDRFALSHQSPVLVAALRLAGARMPVDPATHAAMAANACFTVMGHLSGSYSLAEVNRALAIRIEAERPGAVRLVPVEGDVATRVCRIPASERDLVHMLLSRPAPASSPHVVISQHYPVFVPQPAGDVALAMFFWEESRIPPATVAVLNEGFAGVVAPSRVVAKALVDSGVERPVRVVAPAPLLDRFRRLRAERWDLRVGDPPGHDRPFSFLHVSSCFPRKGVDSLLAAYARAFRRTDAVRLVIKGFPNPHNDVAAQVERLQAHDADAPAIELIDADLDEAAVLDLYRSADAVVLPSRGEGYNLPAAEALAAGIPLIVTGYGGHMDFVGEAPPGAVRLVAYALAASGSHLANGTSVWAEPDVGDLAAALLEAARLTPHASNAVPAPEAPVRIAERLASFAADLLLMPPPREVDVAWVSSWDVRCGVAEYSRQLVAALGTSPGSLALTVLADGRTPAGASVVPSWTLGHASSVASLSAAVMRLDSRAVVVQHQPGLLPWSALAGLLTAPALDGRVVCTALHNTGHLQEIDPADRALALQALASVSRVVVHTLADVNRLAALGVQANVTLIPHGAPPPAALAPSVDRLAVDAPVLIGCYGFFLPGKGLPELIEALALLRRDWPAARLRLVNAEYPGPSAALIQRCREIAAAAGLEGEVEFATDFLENAESAALLGGCDLIVLPYQHSIESSSAALRFALATLVPVAVTPVALFDEAADSVIRLRGTSPVDIADGISAALSDVSVRAAAVAAARAWLAGREWPSVGRQWTALLRGLSASGCVRAAAGDVRNDAATTLR